MVPLPPAQSFNIIQYHIQYHSKQERPKMSMSKIERSWGTSLTKKIQKFQPGLPSSIKALLRSTESTESTACSASASPKRRPDAATLAQLFDWCWRLLGMNHRDFQWFLEGFEGMFNGSGICPTFSPFAPSQRTAKNSATQPRHQQGLQGSRPGRVGS